MTGVQAVGGTAKMGYVINQRNNRCKLYIVAPNIGTLSYQGAVVAINKVKPKLMLVSGAHSDYNNKNIDIPDPHTTLQAKVAAGHNTWSAPLTTSIPNDIASWPTLIKRALSDAAIMSRKT